MTVLGKMGGYVGLIVIMFVLYSLVNNVFYGDVYRQSARQRETIQLQLESQKAQEEIRRAQEWSEFQSDLLDGLRSLGTILFFVILVAAIVFFTYVGTLIHWRRIQNANRERYKSLDGGRYTVDTQTSEVMDAATGNVFASQATPAKLLLHGQVERIRALGETGQRFNSNMGKTALGAWQVKALPEASIANPALLESSAREPEPEYDIELLQNSSQLMEYASAEQWVLGQNTEDGSLCEFSVKEDSNLLVFGSKGMGKTQLAMMLLAYARSNGWHVLVADGKGGVDFRKYADQQLIEWFPLDESNILRFMIQLDDIYKERLQLLSEARCSELDDYIDQTGHQLPRVLVIVEEYGATIEYMRSIKALRKDADTVLALFGSIFKRARCTGIHIVTLDQTINSNDIYNNSIKANGLYVSYKLPAQQFRVFGLPQAVKFLERGHFIEETNHDDQPIKTFYTEGDLDLTNLPKQTFPPLMPELSMVSPQFERGQNTGVSREMEPGSGVFAPVHTGVTPVHTSVAPPLHQSAPAEHQRHTSETERKTEDIDWAYYASLRGAGRDQILKQELPKLFGEPIELEEIQYVIDAYHHLPSKNAVYAAVWGSKNSDRQEWLDDIIDEYFTAADDNEEL